MCRYLNSSGQFKGIMEVPDPYYGGTKGFELVRVLHAFTFDPKTGPPALP